MVNNYLTEYGYYSINHTKEELCGDHIESLILADGTYVLVLADGLGSGVKANILSTLTAKLLSTMIGNKLSINECVKTVAETLPVCKVRKVAYSTFTIIKVTQNRYVEIYNYDNPMPFVLRDGKMLPLEITSMLIDNKTIYHTSFETMLNDTCIMMSDGIIHAGIGASLNFGWDLNEIIDFMEALYKDSYSAKALATQLVSHVNDLYANKPGDDATCAVVKIRARKQVSLLIGPASNKEDDKKMLSLFFAKEGKHIVSGGTTSHLVADFLHKELEFPLTYLDKEIPPTAIIEGVDLVTEGVITISKVLEYSNNYFKDNQDYFIWSFKEDGASQIARLLFEEATDINFYVGCAINPAHQVEGLPITFKTKMQLVEALASNLRLMNKNIKISYF